jgi:2-dehydropantoate 2-reductase
MRRASIGEVLDNPGSHRMLIDAARETAAVAHALGVPIGGDIEGLVDAQTRDMPRDGRPSMLEDLEAGRPLEVEYLSGAVVRLGAQAGIPTPIHSAAVRELSAYATR